MSEQNKSGVFNEHVTACLHEFSTMTSDPGSPRQPIHPDNSWTPTPVLYTAFVALQDIDDEMGPTLFLPGTNTKEAHQQFFHEDSQVRTEFCKRVEYCTSSLKKGDVQIMDSRVLHAGLDNRSQDRRRTLFYFTIRNPRCNPRDFVGVPSGSMYSDVRIDLEDFISASTSALL
jgi:ectoine hydroxylase-related dioxygenase (phytanoyl-CoA dioxygenase family)